MKIGKHKVVTRDHYPVLQVEIDGKTAQISTEHKALQYGLVYLGPDFEEDYTATLPANLEDGRPEEQTLYGVTDDEELVALVRAFVEGE